MNPCVTAFGFGFVARVRRRVVQSRPVAQRKSWIPDADDARRRATAVVGKGGGGSARRQQRESDRAERGRLRAFFAAALPRGWERGASQTARGRPDARGRAREGSRRPSRKRARPPLIAPEGPSTAPRHARRVSERVNATSVTHRVRGDEWPAALGVRERVEQRHAHVLDQERDDERRRAAAARPPSIPSVSNAMTRARCAPPPLVADHVAPRAEPRWARSCASAIVSSPPSPRAARRVRTARRVHERGAATDDRREPRRREEARGPYLMPAEQWTRHARFALHAPETNAETCGAAGQRARAITDRARRYRSRTSRRAGRCGGNAPGGRGDPHARARR